MSTLRMILNSFVTRYGQGSPELSKVIALGDPLQLSHSCHALRGACAAIGATTLQQQLLDIELAATRPTPDPQLMPRAQALIQDLVALSARIAAELGADTPHGR
jgi:HPt (histidine-containing phosphotransfer) domain-containing protein